MTHNEKLVTVRAMQRYGGSFVRILAAAWLLADEINEQRIESTWPNYMRAYGPGSNMYAETEKEEA